MGLGVINKLRKEEAVPVPTQPLNQRLRVHGALESDWLATYQPAASQ